MGDVTPCASCPWRRGARPERIPNFSAQKLVCDLDQTRGDGDAFRPIMACHLSTDGDERPCIDYVNSTDGYANLAVRMMVVRGELNMAAVGAACADLDLVDDYDQMRDNLMGDINR